MNLFLKAFRSELIKSKGSYGLISSIGVTVFINVLYFLVFYFRHEYFAKLGANPWQILTSNILNTMGLLFPFYLILIAYLITSTEHRANAWKYIYTLPVPKTYFYFGKMILLVWWVLIAVVISYGLNMLSGNLLSVLRPDIGFQDYNINYLIFVSYIKLFIVSLPVLFLQFVLSMVWPNFFRSMGSGFFLFVLCMIFSSWKHNYLLPYSYIYSIAGAFYDSKTAIFEKTVLFSFMFTILFTLSGYYFVKRLQIKN